MTMNTIAQSLIDNNECILLDRVAWGKDYRASILIPPPHSDSVQRDEAPAMDGKQDYALYQTVIDMVEGVVNEALMRCLPESTPVVYKTEHGVSSNIITLMELKLDIAQARRTFTVK